MPDSSRRDCRLIPNPNRRATPASRLRPRPDPAPRYEAVLFSGTRLTPRTPTPASPTGNHGHRCWNEKRPNARQPLHAQAPHRALGVPPDASGRGRGAVRSPPCRCLGAPPPRRQPPWAWLATSAGAGRGAAPRLRVGAPVGCRSSLTRRGRRADRASLPHPTGGARLHIAPDDTAPRPLFASEAPAPPAPLMPRPARIAGCGEDPPWGPGAGTVPGPRPSARPRTSSQSAGRGDVGRVEHADDATDLAVTDRHAAQVGIEFAALQGFGHKATGSNYFTC